MTKSRPSKRNLLEDVEEDSGSEKEKEKNNSIGRIRLTRAKKPRYKESQDKKERRESDSEEEDYNEGNSQSSAEEEQKSSEEEEIFEKKRKRIDSNSMNFRGRKDISYEEWNSENEIKSESSSDENEEESDGPTELIDAILATSKITPKKSHEEDSTVDQRTLKYLVKPNGKSYLHVEWLSEEDLLNRFRNAKSKLSKYLEKKQNNETITGGYFDPNYVQIDRIISQRGIGEKLQLLVKWKSLNYDECTWEYQKDLLSKVKPNKRPLVLEKINEYKRFNSLDSLKRIEKIHRPKAAEYDKDSIEIPKFKNDNKLKSYQVEGFKWLVHCYYHKRSSILADEMGLGKTIQAASILEYLYSTLKIGGPFLIVAPMSTIAQWKRELEGWTEMNVVVFQGSAAARSIVKDYEWHFENKKTAVKFNALVTTYEVVLREAAELKKVHWQYCIVDEGHRIKNQNSKLFLVLKTFKCAHKLILTGTPLQNGVKELWTLMNFLEPRRFADCDSFLEEFGELKETSQVEKLHDKLGPYLLRRMKEDVETSIPKKEETLIELELTVIQKQYYRAILEKNREFLSKGTSKTNLLNIFMEQRKICNHPYLLHGAEERILGASPEDIPPETLGQKLIASSSKFIFMDKLLSRLRIAGSRVLIFSQMVRLLDILEDYVEFKGYPFERLDGSDNSLDRQSAIDRFQNPGIDKFIFLLSTKAGGLGINLTIADTVVLFDSDWNPQNDIQAQARVHRIGQLKPVKVYRLISKNTYEKLMFQTASKKLGLDHVVLGKKAKVDGEEIGEDLTKEEIERLLKHGAYNQFNQTKEEEDFDFDKIMEKAEIITYGSAPSQNKLLAFSKATFAAQEDGADIDVNDAQFWDKIIPNFKTASRMSGILKEPNALDTEEKRENFIRDIDQLIKDVQDQELKRHSNAFNFNPFANLQDLVNEAQNSNFFNNQQMLKLKEYSQLLFQPRLRKRKKHQKLPLEAVEDKDHKDDNYEAPAETEEPEIQIDDLEKVPKKKMFTVRSTPSTIAPTSLSAFRPSAIPPEFVKHLVSTKSLVSFPLSSGAKTSPYFSVQQQATVPVLSPSSEKKQRKCAQCGQLRKGHTCPLKNQEEKLSKYDPVKIKKQKTEDTVLEENPTVKPRKYDIAPLDAALLFKAISTNGPYKSPSNNAKPEILKEKSQDTVILQKKAQPNKQISTQPSERHQTPEKKQSNKQISIQSSEKQQAPTKKQSNEISSPKSWQEMIKEKLKSTEVVRTGLTPNNQKQSPNKTEHNLTPSKPTTEPRLAILGSNLIMDGNILEGWIVKTKERKSGKSAGIKDHYFVSPKTTVLRSLKQVARFLEQQK